MGAAGAKRQAQAIERSAQIAKETALELNKRSRADVQPFRDLGVQSGQTLSDIFSGKANISDSYAIVKDGEVFLLNLHISPYEQASYYNHEPTRTRKLLLHRKEIRKMIGAVERQGLTLIPLEVYFKRGKAKVSLALGKGKKLYDKRADEKRRDDERDMQRAVRTR